MEREKLSEIHVTFTDTGPLVFNERTNRGGGLCTLYIVSSAIIRGFSAVTDCVLLLFFPPSSSVHTHLMEIFHSHQSESCVSAFSSLSKSPKL